MPSLEIIWLEKLTQGENARWKLPLKVERFFFCVLFSPRDTATVYPFWKYNCQGQVDCTVKSEDNSRTSLTEDEVFLYFLLQNILLIMLSTPIPVTLYCLDY